MFTDEQFKEIVKLSDTDPESIAAFQLVRTLHVWTGFCDNAVDNDRAFSIAEASRMFVEIVHVLAFNPFFQQHKATIVPFLINGAVAWEDSEDWRKREDIQSVISADVLKSHYAEFVWHIAYLRGGYNHMRDMTTKYRRYDYEDVIK